MSKESWRDDDPGNDLSEGLVHEAAEAEEEAERVNRAGLGLIVMALLLLAAGFCWLRYRHGVI